MNCIQQLRVSPHSYCSVYVLNSSITVPFTVYLHSILAVCIMHLVLYRLRRLSQNQTTPLFYTPAQTKITHKIGYCKQKKWLNTYNTILRLLITGCGSVCCVASVLLILLNVSFCLKHMVSKKYWYVWQPYRLLLLVICLLHLVSSFVLLQCINYIAQDTVCKRFFVVVDALVFPFLFTVA